MFLYHIKTSFRSLKKSNKTFFINLIGLSTAFACFILVMLWVVDEYSIDKFHKSDDELFQVMLNYKNGNDLYTFEWTPIPLREALLSEIPSVKFATNLYSFRNEGIISNHKKSSLRTKEVYVGNDFFSMFSFEILKGSTNELERKINNVMISDKLATSLFGSTENVLGKTVEFSQQKLSGLYQVSGIFKAVSINSTLQFNAVFSSKKLTSAYPNMLQWESNEPRTYVALHKGTDVQKFNTQLTNLIQKKSSLKNISAAFVRPFSDAYLYNSYENGVQSGGRITFVRLFIVIALFIMAIAIINFVNLSTAQAISRVKEIGVKKVLGIRKKGLVIQFLSESLLISFLSLIVALILVFIMLPEFNSIVGKQIKMDFSFINASYLILLVIVTAILSGTYPSLYLSSFNMIKLLRGKFSTKKGNIRIREALVVFQFSISIFLIIAIIITTKQIDLIQTKDLGFNNEEVLIIKREGKLKTNLESFLSEVRQIPGVKNATSLELSHLTNNTTGSRNVVWDGQITDNNQVFKYILAGYDFTELLNINLINGRSFSNDFGSEENKIILNETAVKAMSMKNPIGQTVKISNQNFQVIGVVEDFHFESLYKKVQPLFIKLSTKGDEILIKMAKESEGKILASIQDFYSEFNFGLPLNFSFLDAQYDASYTKENRLTVLSKYFGFLAIILSCLGLFGLVTFNVSQRVKEIGIRKVLGNTVLGLILLLLSKDFLKLIVIALFIAIPISWLILNKWLEEFAYRVQITFWILLVASLISLVIALLTISIQTVKAAISNPIKNLRTE